MTAAMSYRFESGVEGCDDDVAAAAAAAAAAGGSGGDGGEDSNNLTAFIYIFVAEDLLMVNEDIVTGVVLEAL